MTGTKPLQVQFSRDFDFNASASAIKRELITLAHETPYHPIIDYLDGLAWDGVPRLDTWLHDYCGAEDTELNREFASKLLIAGVRRIKKPGVKFDTMLVLEGAQGAGKSQLVQALAVRLDWFCGSLDLKSDDKTKAELLSRAWIVECQELDGLSRATSQTLKRFLSTSTDNYRRAYNRDTGEYRRHCIILGTTNETAYLRDLSGNRRIWPVLVRRVDLDGFRAQVDQLWAEAVVREAKGEAISLSAHLWEEANSVQQQRMVEDAYSEVLEDALAERSGKISMESIKLLIGLNTSKMSPSDSRRIQAAMERLGWEYGTYRLHDLALRGRDPRRGFARGNPEARKIEMFVQMLTGGIPAVTYVDEVPGKSIPF